RCARASRSIRRSRATARSRRIPCRCPRSPTTSARPPIWWTRSASINDLSQDEGRASVVTESWIQTRRPRLMISAKFSGRPLRWPARLHLHPARTAIASVAGLAALLALAPLASLIALAFANTGDLWSHLARYVLPFALV